MKISHILVCTDLSDASRIGYGHAAAIARANQATVSLLYVDELADQGFHDSASMLRYLEHMASVQRQRLAEAEAAFDELGVVVQVLQRPGHPAETIGAVRDELGADLVVMTRHGGHGTGPLGSTSQRVVREAEVPILVAHEPVGEAEATSGYKRILVATDFSESSTIGLRAAASYAESIAGELRLAHVWRNPGSAIPVSPDQMPLEPTAEMEQLQRAHEKRFNEWLDEVGVGHTDHVVVRGHSAAVGLIAAAIEWSAHVICIPSHGKGPLEAALTGSTADRLLMLSPLPVLVLPRVWLVHNRQG